MKPEIRSFRALIDEMKDVAAGRAKPPARGPKRLFASERVAAQYRATAQAHSGRELGIESLAVLARLMTPENRRLVSYLSSHEVASIAELARRMNRAESNLNRTIKKFEQLGIITMQPGEGKTRIPRLNVGKLRLELDVPSGRVVVMEVGAST